MDTSDQLQQQEPLVEGPKIRITAHGMELKFDDGTIGKIAKEDLNRNDIIFIALELSWLSNCLEYLSISQWHTSVAGKAVREIIRRKLQLDADIPVSERAMCVQVSVLSTAINGVVRSLRELIRMGIVKYSIKGQPFVSAQSELDRYLKMIPPSA